MVAIPRAVSGGLQSAITYEYDRQGNLLQYRERYQEGYNMVYNNVVSSDCVLQYRERYQEGYNSRSISSRGR